MERERLKGLVLQITAAHCYDELHLLEGEIEDMLQDLELDEEGFLKKYDLLTSNERTEFGEVEPGELPWSIRVLCGTYRAVRAVERGGKALDLESLSERWSGALVQAGMDRDDARRLAADFAPDVRDLIHGVTKMRTPTGQFAPVSVGDHAQPAEGGGLPRGVPAAGGGSTQSAAPPIDMTGAVSEHALYWNTFFSDEPELNATRRVRVGESYWLETALEEIAHGALSSAVIDETLTEGDRVRFELLGRGIGLRIDPDDPLAEWVESPALVFGGAERIGFGVYLQAREPGSHELRLRLFVNAALVLQQQLALTAVSSTTSTSRDGGPLLRSSTSYPALSSNIAQGAFPVRPAEVRIEIEERLPECRLRVEVGGIIEKLTCPGGHQSIVDEAIRVRAALVELSERYRAAKGAGSEFALEDGGATLLRFAQLGARIHEAFFGHPEDRATSEPLTRCAEVLAGVGRARPAPRMQIVAEHLPFPWGIVYDGLAYGRTLDADDPARRRYEAVPTRVEDVDPLCFWGRRFQIDRALSGLLHSLAGRTLARDDERALSVRPCLNPHLDDEQQLSAVANHQAFFRAVCKGHGLSLAPVQSRAEYEAFLRSREPAPCDLLYFFCHARAAESVNSVFFHVGVPPRVQASILLDDAASGREVNIDEMRRLRMRALDGHPLVFMNACSTAAGDQAFQSLFVTHFVGTWGARGFVGTDWKVPTAFADAFGRRVLDLFLRGGLTLADAFSRAAEPVLEQLNPFPLIYALYARPELTARGGQHG